MAALDVGTNSIRLIVVEVLADGSYRLLDDEKEVTRLGLGLATSAKLSSKPMTESAAAIARMITIAEGYGVKNIRAVATSAVREAKNRQHFLRMVRETADIDLEVISAEDEARLAYHSVAHAFDLRSMNAAVVDIGGGSTEVVISSFGAVEKIHALKLGAVRLTELFGCELSPRDYADMRDSIKSTIRQKLKKPRMSPQLVIGVGGTFTALAAISIASQNEMQSSQIRGHELQRSEVKHILDNLRSMSVKARAKIPGLNLDRAEIVVAGIAIIDCLMRHLRVNTLRIHDRGIRDGLLLSMIRKEFPKLTRTPVAHRDRIQSARKFASLCNYEVKHSEHVTKLALIIFDQMARLCPSKFWTTTRRELLEAAAILHDIGYYINYAKHHKHSHHLIVHSELAGFTSRELNVVGNIARYHRRSEPSKDHPAFASLELDDRRVVRRLAAILRIADGLDRTHAQAVQSITLERNRAKMRFILLGSAEPTVDIWGAERKSRLFRRVFGLKPSFEWSGRANSTDRAPRELQVSSS
jgi:exopolyphosphatase / guanosine-5'-triphosphate,3'-diphosphate pyrophosphatase